MMNMRIKILLVITFVFGAQDLSLAQQASIHLSLPDALKLARRQNVSVIVAQERIKQAIAQIGESRSNLLPQLKASASESRQTRDLRSSGIAFPGTGPLIGPFNSFDARLKLTQTLFDFSAMERLNTAASNRQLSVAEYNRTQQDVLAFVAILYIQAQRAEENLRVVRFFVKKDLQQLTIDQSRLRCGLGSELEVKQAKANYQESLLRWHSSVKETLDRRLDLLAALGLDNRQRIIFKKYQNVYESTLLSQQKIEEILKDHPDMIAALKQKEASVRNLGAEKKELLPKISVFGDYGPNGVDPKTQSETYTLGVQASIPIWEGGLRGNRIKEAESQAKQAEATVNDTKRKTENKILSSIEAIKQAKSTVQYSYAQLELLSQEMKVSSQRFKLGTASQQDLLNAQAQWILAKDSHREAIATNQIAEINLVHALGQMEKLVAQDKGDVSEK